jgi:FMN hydrolase / 5-amino-6-(5-phospho-D-ribitylamino)uracil phosphatase
MAPSSSSSAVRGVTFDLDDTLWCGATVIRRASAAFHSFLATQAPRVAEAFPPAEFYAVLGQLQRELPDKAHDYTFLRKHALRRCVADAGGWTHETTDYDEAALERFVDEAFQAFLIPRSEPEFFDGVELLLQQLHEELRTDTIAGGKRVVAMGVITNGNCLLDRLPAFFQGHMDFMVSAEGVGTAKPAAAIFDAAFAHFDNTLKRDEIVHVGDHYEADVAGAKRAGFRTIWIDAKRPKPDVFHRRDMDAEDAGKFPEADAIVTNVCAVADVIRQWNRENARRESVN